MGVIVVAVDGSAGSAIALDYAIQEALLRGSKLRLVSAWEIPPSVLASVVAGKEFYEEFRENAIRVAEEAARYAREKAPELEVEQVVAEGQAGKVILDNSKDAELIVVGRRGHGTFREMLLGSIARQVVAHARVPVTVVTAPPEKKEGDKQSTQEG